MVKQTIMRHPESHSIAPARRLALVLLAAAAWFSACSFEPTTVGLCMTDAHCSGGQVCDLAQSICVRLPVCEQHSECTAIGMPICDTTCRRCNDATECMMKDSRLTVCAPDGACIEPEPQTCGGDSNECTPELPMCDGTECVACSPNATGDAACAIHYGDSNKPICTQASICGECRNDSHCTAEEPVCNVDTGACRACQANSECESNVCDKLSGQCAAPADVLYVDGTDGVGMDSDTCGGSGGTPCQTIGAALARVEPDTLRYIRIEPEIYPQALSISGKEVVLVGEDATIQPAPGQTNRPVLSITDGARVVLQGIIVAGATAGTSADGIECLSNSEVSLLSTTVASNAYLGIDTLQCSLTLERSTIAKNLGGGISIRDTEFSITNTLIVDNGDVATTAFGGVKIDNSAGISRQVFSFNTVARNKAQDLGDASGVRCSTTGTVMTASNNIVFEGFGNAATVDGNCLWSYSNIEGGRDGTGNIDADPMFVDSANGDFHIKPGSPCQDAADPAATITLDFDGNPRPSGDAPDIGADEIVPAPMQ